MSINKEIDKILNAYIKLARKLGKFPTRTEFEPIVSERQYRKHFGTLNTVKQKVIELHPELALPTINKDLKVLIFDIETAPILAHVWGLFDQNVGLNQIQSDWHVLSWAAKWADDPSSKILYQDQRNAKDVTNDKKILESIRDLLDQADLVVTQNGIKFDSKKLNARFLFHDIKSPSSYRHRDTLRMAKKHFNLTSYKLEYMTDKFCKKYKKLKHKKFPGHELWKECLKGNKEAWKEMEKYNKHDVLATEELYNILKEWDFRKYS
jgi:DNA polymerase elongation subunit (family B)